MKVSNIIRLATIVVLCSTLLAGCGRKQIIMTAIPPLMALTSQVIK